MILLFIHVFISNWCCFVCAGFGLVYIAVAVVAKEQHAETTRKRLTDNELR